MTPASASADRSRGRRLGRRVGRGRSRSRPAPHQRGEQGQHGAGGTGSSLQYDRVPTPHRASVDAMDAADWDARYATSELVWSRDPTSRSRPSAPTCRRVAPSTWPAARAATRSGWRRSAGRSRPSTSPRWPSTRGVGLAGDVAVEWVCADATQWRGEGYDLAVVAYFQVPADARRAAVRHVVESLRPGGTLLWVGHDTTNLTEGTGGPQDPRVLMTAEDLLDDLDGIPVEVERAERVARVVTGRRRPRRRGASGRPGTASCGSAAPEVTAAPPRLTWPPGLGAGDLGAQHPQGAGQRRRVVVAPRSTASRSIRALLDQRSVRRPGDAQLGHRLRDDRDPEPGRHEGHQRRGLRHLVPDGRLEPGVAAQRRPRRRAWPSGRRPECTTRPSSRRSATRTRVRAGQPVPLRQRHDVALPAQHVPREVGMGLGVARAAAAAPGRSVPSRSAATWSGESISPRNAKSMPGSSSRRARASARQQGVRRGADAARPPADPRGPEPIRCASSPAASTAVEDRPDPGEVGLPGRGEVHASGGPAQQPHARARPRAGGSAGRAAAGPCAAGRRPGRSAAPRRRPGSSADDGAPCDPDSQSLESSRNGYFPILVTPPTVEACPTS